MQVAAEMDHFQTKELAEDFLNTKGKSLVRKRIHHKRNEESLRFGGIMFGKCLNDDPDLKFFGTHLLRKYLPYGRVCWELCHCIE